MPFGRFALAITLYVAVIGAMTNIGRCRTLQQELWFANLASTNLWYTFAKVWPYLYTAACQCSCYVFAQQGQWPRWC